MKLSAVCQLSFLTLICISPLRGQSQSLGVALDNTNLVWTTSPSNLTSRPFLAVTDVSYDGVDSVQSGNTFVPSSTSWLQTTVVGPGTLSFWWTVSSLAPDELEFSVNSVLQESISGDTVDWTFRLYELPAGTNILRWSYVKDATVNDGVDAGWLDQVIYTTNAPMPLQEAVNTCGVTWTTGGNVNPTYWSGQTNVSMDGKAAESGAIYSRQESWMQTVVSGISNISFQWRVSSETNLDFLQFYTNDVLVSAISGEVTAWRSNFHRFSAQTTNTLKWRYVKNDFDVLFKGQDRGWVDKVTFSPPLRAFPYTMTSPTRLPDGRFRLTIMGEVGCACRVQYSTNLSLTNWTTLTNFTTTTANSIITDAGASNSTQRFYLGVSP